MHQFRAVILTGYLEVAHGVGLDGARMLREAGFGPEALADPENRLPATAVIRLIEQSAEKSGCESFGLLLAEKRTSSNLGPVSLLLEHLPNLRELLRAAVAYRRHINDVMSLALEDGDDTCVIRLDFEPGFWSVQMNDLYVGVAYRMLNGFSGGRWQPSVVYVVRKAPDDLAAWRRVVPVKVEFESSFTGFSCSAASLLIPNPLADDVMARNARGLLRLVPLESGPRPINDRVRRSIGLLLPSGRTTLAHVAAHLGMSPRSLQRRLEDEGHHYGELLSEVRQELAAAYLGSSAQPVTTVAGLLGYGSPSSFTRWFSGTFGTTPQAWRAHRATRELDGPPPVWRRQAR